MSSARGSSATNAAGAPSATSLAQSASAGNPARANGSVSQGSGIMILLFVLLISVAASQFHM